jgi:hypothetical protein
VRASALIMAGLWCGAASAAPLVFFGQDPGLAGEADPYTAEQDFVQALGLRGLLLGRQGFEGLAPGVPAEGLSLEFLPLPPELMSATLAAAPVSGDSLVRDASQSQEGRYPVAGERWLDLGAARATFSFSTPVLAFGFYAVDAGDRGGQLALDLGGGVTLPIPHALGEDGLLLYYGVVLDAPVLQLALVNSAGAADLFGIDELTVAAVPLPPALGLLASALIALAPRTRRARA